MHRKNGESWTCSCGAAVVAATTKARRQAPVTVEPKDDGNVLLFRSAELDDETRRPRVECRTIADEHALMFLRSEGVPLRLNHFADCPDRDRYGKPKASKA